MKHYGAGGKIGEGKKEENCIINGIKKKNVASYRPPLLCWLVKKLILNGEGGSKCTINTPACRIMLEKSRVAPDIRPFLKSGIRPDIQFRLPDMRPDKDIRPEKNFFRLKTEDWIV